MKATLVDLDLAQIDSSGKPLGEGRSEGVHLSSIIKWARGQTEDKLADSGNDNFMSMGWIFEVMLEQGFKTFGAMMGADRKNVKRPGEQLLDGIYMTPDGLDGTILEEYKLTYKSLARLTGSNPKKGDCAGDVDCWLRNFHWWWLVQMMSYCWVLGTDRARLIALFVNGDYSFHAPLGGPQVVAVDITFFEPELRANWETVLSYRDKMLLEATSHEDSQS